MPPRGKRRAETGTRRRMAKRQVTPNSHWLHLSSAENDLKFIIQSMLFALSMYCSAMTQLLGILFALEATADIGNVDDDALDTAIESIITVLVAFTRVEATCSVEHVAVTAGLLGE